MLQKLCCKCNCNITHFQTAGWEILCYTKKLK